MPDLGNGNGNKLVENVALIMVSRFATIAASAMLPILGALVLFMLNRGISSVDDMSRKVDTVQQQTVETNGNVKLIQQTQTLQGATLADHEGRLRGIEGRPKPPPN